VFHTLRNFSLGSFAFLYVVLTQACLGVLTLLLQVPLSLALVHQAGAMVVLTTALWNLHARLLIRWPDPDPL
jgi:cytochrome c oxidase assembly protein subunit 15